ncbi:MAG: protein DpdD [Bryobacteraceae bacterium]
MSFEGQFFGPGNRLSWDAIAGGQLSPDTQRRLGPFLDNFRRNLPYSVLPRVLPDGRVHWYVLCSSPRATRIARDELRAFLGQSYSDFEGRPPALDPSDPIDSAVMANYGSNVFKIEIPTRDLFETARQRLQLLMQLGEERPARTTLVPRAVGRILRDFEYALLAQDIAAAGELINELQSAGHLDAINLLYLEVRRLAAGEAWSQILTLAGLNSLLRTRRPRRVTEAIIFAVYHVHLADYVAAAQAEAAVRHFKTEIAPRFSSLYGARDGLDGFEVTASFLVSAIAAEPQRVALAESLLAVRPIEPIEQRFFEALTPLVKAPDEQPEADLDRAAVAFSIGDTDSAFRLASMQPNSVRRTVLLLRCAREMETLDAAELALQALGDLPDAERTALSRSAVLRSTIDELQRVNFSPEDHQRSLPHNWLEWLQRLEQEQPWNAAVVVAERGAREWPRDELWADSSRIQLCADLLLSEHELWAQIALRNSAPYMIESLLGNEAKTVLTPVYESLFLILALDSDPSVAQVRQLARLGVARMETGPSSADYSAMLRQLAEVFFSVGTPSVIETALDSFENTIINACPSPAERLMFASRIGELIQKWFTRVDEAYILLFNSLATDIQAPRVAVPQAKVDEDGPRPSDTAWRRLSGKRIAIYSLQEAAARRAAAIVQDLASVAVEIFSDHVGGSPALRQASLKSDVFLLVTAAAKHAATGFIEANRPRSATTLYARGKGCASILNALRSFLTVAKE